MRGMKESCRLGVLRVDGECMVPLSGIYLYILIQLLGTVICATNRVVD